VGHVEIRDLSWASKLSLMHRTSGETPLFEQEESQCVEVIMATIANQLIGKPSRLEVRINLSPLAGSWG